MEEKKESVESNTRKISKPAQKVEADDDDLIKLDDDDEFDEDDEDNLYYDMKAVKDSQPSSDQKDFDEILSESRHNLKQSLQNIPVGKDGNGGNSGGANDIQERFARLKKERELLLERKKRDRDEEVSQYTAKNCDSP